MSRITQGGAGADRGRPPGRGWQVAPGQPRLPKCPRPPRRRHSLLARAGPVRRHHRDGRRARVPRALLDHLATGGRLIMPVGSAHRFQHLVRVTRTGRDNYDHEDLEEVAFVPLIGFGATEEGCSSSTSSSVTPRRAIVPLLAVGREPGGLRCAIRLPRPGHRPGPIRAKAARLSLRSPGAAVGHSGGDPRRLPVGHGVRGRPSERGGSL